MIIGVSGKIGSGKDTVGKIIQYLTDIKSLGFTFNPSEQDYNRYIINEHNLHANWEIKKLAGKLKQIVSLVTGVPIEDLEKEEVKNSYLPSNWDRLIGKKGWFDNDNRLTQWVPITVRQFLQEVGTDAMRNVIHPNFWVNALFVDYKPTYNTKHPITVDTAPNWIITDVRFPNELKAIKDRGGVVIRVNRYDITGQGKLNPHTSETALDNAEFDYVIDNYGTIEDLIVKVKDILIAEKII